MLIRLRSINTLPLNAVGSIIWYWHESRSLVCGQTRDDNTTPRPSFCLGSALQHIVFGGSYVHVILYSTYRQNSPSSSTRQYIATCCYVVKFITTCPNHSMISLLSSELLRFAFVLRLKSLLRLTTQENDVRDSQLLRKIGEDTDEGALTSSFREAALDALFSLSFDYPSDPYTTFVSTKYCHASHLLTSLLLLSPPSNRASALERFSLSWSISTLLRASIPTTINDIQSLSWQQRSRY